MKVYVYEGYRPRGGTFMAYHLGLILQRHSGLSVHVVGSPLQAGSPFEYPVVFPVMSHEAFVEVCTRDDLLICNPSFSDRMFGPTLPCRKLCYMQHFSSFRYLDGFFDHYVFVSHFVKSFVEGLYALRGPVIPAFVDVPAAGEVPPFAQRADRAILPEWKVPEPVRSLFVGACQDVNPSSSTALDVIPLRSQRELAAEMRSSRYFVSLTVSEGLGLPMLEAMANGCAVLGFANGGNSEFARDGENSRIVQYPRLGDLARTLARISANPKEASHLAAAGRATAENFSYPNFVARWVEHFRQIL